MLGDVYFAHGLAIGMTCPKRHCSAAGLAVALLDARERELRERTVNGPPPLGPEEGPARRVVAFIEAYVRLLGRPVGLSF
jgi:hypothetical protein